MPTGYTASIYEGKDITLTEFAANCARGMGVFMHMRDEATGAPLAYPKSSGNTFYSDNLVRVIKETEEWTALSEGERYAEWSIYYNNLVKDKAERKLKDSIVRTRYLDMIKRVTDVEVPSKLESFKEFMLGQLNESMDFDCHDDDFYERYNTPLEYFAWSEERSKTLSRIVNTYSQHVNDEAKRGDDREEYIDLLVETFNIKVIRHG
jgi:hypothetical protein